MSACTLVGVGRLARAARAHLVEAGHRGGGATAPRRGRVAMPAGAAVSGGTLLVRRVSGRVLTPVALAVVACFRVLSFGTVSFRMLLRGRVRLFAHPGNGLPDQLLDRRDAPAVGGRHDGDGGAAPSGAPGAADAMDVVVGGMRNVEVEDVADGGECAGAG